MNAWRGFTAPSPSRRAERPGLGWLAALGLCLGLAACSGGGGGSDADVAQPGVLKVTVNDAYGSKVAGATVQATLDTLTAPSRSTDASGVALLATNWPAGTATVTVSRATFLDKTVSAVIVKDRINEVTLTLDRATSAAGGSLTTRSGSLATLDAGTQQLSFEIELVAVDGDALPIENLSAANFVLRPCTPDPANSASECVQRAGATADVAYAPLTATPGTATLIPGQPARPYAAALMLDQSGSIQLTDPTGARLFSAKAFLSGLGDSDRVLLAAFASDTGAVIPTRPLTLYPPFQDRLTAPASYFPELDALGRLVGGDTPLFSSIDSVRQTLVGEASLAADLAKAIVVFTDGADTTCGSPETCTATREATIQQALADEVRLFTIGLSSGVDFEALAELANKTGGAFLYAENAEQLIPLYGTVGRLLSLSLPTYRLRWTVQAAAPGQFQSGDQLLGRVQVSSGSNTFEVPFIVRIP